MDKCGVSRIQVGHIVFYNNMGWRVHIFLMKKADASFTESDERKELSLDIPNRIFANQLRKFGNIPNLGHVYQIKPVKDNHFY